MEKIVLFLLTIAGLLSSFPTQGTEVCKTIDGSLWCMKTQCPPDMVSRSTNANYSSMECVCRRGDYYQTTGGTCLLCPVGADCSRRDGVLLHELVAQNGYWRTSANSTTFSDCEQGHKGNSAQSIARERCCPVGKCNASGLLHVTGTSMFNTTNDQCADGYTGALCLSCAKDYVLQSGTCLPCKGGGVFWNAFAAMMGSCFLVFCIVCVVLVVSVSAKKAKKSKRYFGQMKIMLTFIQILGSMPSVYDNVPWPTYFLDFLVPLNFFNLDLSIFLKAQCTLSIPFLDQFMLHMMLPVGAIASIALAHVLVSCTCKRKKKQRVRNKQLTTQLFIVAVLLLYPSLATKIFTVFRCKNLDGIMNVLVLEADYSQLCFEGKHYVYVHVAIVFIFLYVIGMPLSLFLALWTNRNDLNDPKSPRYMHVKSSLGGLYLQYSPKYWWFEMVSIVHKMVMTGFMCIVTPGSSSQLLIATLIMLIYMLLVLKTAPFVEESEDLSCFIACFTLTLTYIGGFALISEVNNKENVAPTYNSNLLAICLIGINVLCILIELVIFIIVDVGGCVSSLIKTRQALLHSDALGTTAIFSPLPASARAEIIDIMEIRHVDKGEDLVKQNDAAMEFMVIMKGKANVLVDNVVVRTFGKLDMLGENCLLSHDLPTRGATVRCLTEMTVLVLNRNKYQHLFDSKGLEWDNYEENMLREVRRASRLYAKEDLVRERSGSLEEQPAEENESGGGTVAVNVAGTKVMPVTNDASDTDGPISSYKQPNGNQNKWGNVLDAYRCTVSLKKKDQKTLLQKRASKAWQTVQ